MKANKFGNLEFLGFSVKESFGPFEAGNSQNGIGLLMFETKSGPILLIIESRKIVGIDTKNNKNSEFEIDLNFNIKSFQTIGGCLLCLDSEGKFHLIEIYYETGQVLGTWTLKCEVETEILIEGVKVLEDEKIVDIKKTKNYKYNLMIVIEVLKIGRVICVFSLDPLSEFFVPCSFKHWTIKTNNDENINKNLPDIVRYLIIFLFILKIYIYILYR